MVDLAKFVSGNSFHVRDVESSSVNVTKVQHLTHYVKDYDSRTWINFNILEATRLRTFFQLRHGNIPDRVVQYIPLKFKFLRSLSLHSINTLPDSIKDLKHLCYLDLSNSLISELPESVCGLYNLQTLNLSECRYLKTLPRYMHRLINLRCLRISEECVEMPTQMRKLKNLQTLNIFIVGKEVGRGICELKELSNLRGSLCIKNIRYVVNAEDASEAKLMETKDLKELLLDWGDEDSNSTLHEYVILENLAPSTIIECLEINHYGGTRFPKWVGDPTYYNIVKLELSNCENCISLPPLGQLACLTILTVDGFSVIETVDHGFYRNSACSSMNPFPSLERLELSRMPNWTEWLTKQTRDVVAFPKLEILHIRDCPKLVKNFPNSFSSLTRLSNNNCWSINCSLPTMPLLQSLDLEDCHSLVTLGNLPCTLTRLTIRGCEELEFPFPSPHGSLNHLTIVYSCNSIQCFPLNYFTNLTRLSMRRLHNLESVSLPDEAVQEMESLSLFAILSCPNFVSFPAGGFSAPKLSYLTISSCKKLKCWPEQMHTLFPSLVHMRIARCPEVDSFPAAGFPSNLRAITIAYCDKLVASRSWNLTRLTKLEVFEIVCSSDIMCFPEEGVLPISITSLTINSLSSLETLNRNGLLQLTSLKQLEILFCPNLRTITVEELPNSLEILNVYECPLLDCDELKKRVWECSKDIYVQVTP